jgi:hypothetical protein
LIILYITLILFPVLVPAAVHAIHVLSEFRGRRPSRAAVSA